MLSDPTPCAAHRTVFAKGRNTVQQLGRAVLTSRDGSRGQRRGGAKVALVSVLVEAAGLGLMEFAPSLALALIGAALTGLGYSLVYPELGLEALRRAPADSRGLAMGAYTAFLDVALGFGTPALGLIANMAGLGAVFWSAPGGVLRRAYRGIVSALTPSRTARHSECR
jgi:predicted MFS family arabinose efflux permease